MPLKKAELVSAQIAVQAASGKSLIDGTAVTSENIAEHLPAPEIFEAAQRKFKQLGFEVDNAFGNSFSITAPVSTFEKVFKVKLQREDRGGVKAKAGRAAAVYELPLEALPKELRQHVVAATFSPPPDFGPTGY